MIRTPPGGGTNGNRIRAYDKQSGAVVSEFQLPAGTTGAIMTYRHQGTQLHRRADRFDDARGGVRGAGGSVTRGRTSQPHYGSR
jgi:hypothetical protein